MKFRPSLVLLASLYPVFVCVVYPRVPGRAAGVFLPKGKGAYLPKRWEQACSAPKSEGPSQWDRPRFVSGRR